jgi:hypothetical protein
MTAAVAMWLLVAFLWCLVVDLMYITKQVWKCQDFIKRHADSMKDLTDWATKIERKEKPNGDSCTDDSAAEKDS